MLFVLVFFLVTTLFYILVNILTGIVSNNLDNNEMELIEEQQGKKKVYQGMQYLTLVSALAIFITTFVFIFKPSRLLFKILIFITTISCIIMFISAFVQYSLITKVNINLTLDGRLPAEINKFKHLLADCPRFNIDFGIILLFYIPILYLAYNIHYNETINFFKFNKVAKSKKKAKNDIDEIIKKETFN